MKMQVKLGGVKTLSAKEQKAALKQQKQNPDQCEIIVCIDKKTGLLKVLGAGENCPPGYMRRVDKAFGVGVQINPESLKD
jgi:hypothetical protein